MKPRSRTSARPSGIGDLLLLGQYRFLNDRASRTEAALLFGVKTPTGETDERHGDEVLEAEFQPGSGSWDGLFGLALTQRVGLWSFDSNVLYSLVTEGTQQTDLGDIFLFNAAVSYRLSSLGGPTPMFHGAHAHKAGDDGHGHAHSHAEEAGHGAALDLVLELNGEWHGKQETAGAKDDNSGGTTIFSRRGCVCRSISGPAFSPSAFRSSRISTASRPSRTGASRPAPRSHSEA